MSAMDEDREELRGSLTKGLRILASFDERTPRLSVAEISDRTAINRASVYRLAGVLEGLGYLKKEGATYQPSSKVFELGIPAVESLELVDHIRPHLHRIKAELPDATAINYGVLDGEEIIYLIRLHMDDIIAIRLQVGSRLPAYLSSLGKAILAAMPVDEAETIIGRMRFDPRTSKSPDSAARLRRDVERARIDGIALNDEGLTMGLRSVGAAVFNGSHVVGAVNVAALAARADVDTFVDKYGAIVKAVAEEISAEISAYQA